VRQHQGLWWAILPTMTREDGSPIRPWFKPDDNTKAAAETLLARKLVELDENRLPVPVSDTVAGWIEQLLTHHDVEPSTLSGYMQALRRRIEHPTVGIGEIKLQRLTAVRLDQFYRDLKDEGYSKSTIQQTHRLLSVGLKEAVRKRKLSYSPVQDATLPRFERRTRKALLIDRKKLWTPSELQEFLTHTRDDRWYPVWYVLASTGLRRSEICGLRSESVDLDRAVITVEWKVVAVHHDLHEGDPKSESSIREITIDDGTVQVLRDWRKATAVDRRAADLAWVDSGFEFTDELGRGMDPQQAELPVRQGTQIKWATPHHAARAAAPARDTSDRCRRTGQGREHAPGSLVDNLHAGPLRESDRDRRPQRSPCHRAVHDRVIDSLP
jgi:integrase